MALLFIDAKLDYKKDLKMGKYRFSGVLKEIVLDKSKMMLKFVPDAEYTVSFSEV